VLNIKLRDTLMQNYESSARFSLSDQFR